MCTFKSKFFSFKSFSSIGKGGKVENVRFTFLESVQLCTLAFLHLEWPKHHRLLAILSAVGFKCLFNFYVKSCCELSSELLCMEVLIWVYNML